MLLLASTDWSTASLSVVAFLLGLIVLGSLWSWRREIYIRDQEKRQADSLRDVMAFNHEVTANANAIVLRLTEITQANREIRRELLDFIKEKSADQKQLSLDIEHRLREMILLTHQQGGGPTGVNVFAGDTRQSVNHFSGDNASVAQGQSVNQTKHAE